MRKSKYTHEIVKALFDKEGYTLLSTYTSRNNKLEYICPNGHKHSIHIGNWRSGYRCPECAHEKRRVGIDFVKEQFEKEGYKLLSKEYKNNTQGLEFVCREGHIGEITWLSWRQGRRCRKCGLISSAKKRLFTIDYIKKQLGKEGYRVLSEDYAGAHVFFDYVCPEGHKGSTTWNRWQQKRRCPKCREEKRSETSKRLWREESYQKKVARALAIAPNKPEKYLLGLLKELFPGEYEFTGDFKFWLDGRNPDFMNVNGKKKLIELFGDYWHKDDDPKDRIDHYKRFGFDTLVIWEHELENKNKLVNKLEKFHNG